MPKQTYSGSVHHNGRITVPLKNACHKCKVRSRHGRSIWCRHCLADNPVVLGGTEKPAGGRAVPLPASERRAPETSLKEATRGLWMRGLDRLARFGRRPAP